MRNGSIFNWSSRRSRLARTSHAVASWMIFIRIISISLILLGVVALAVKLPVGWLVLSLAAVPAMIAQWYNYQLKHLPNSSKVETIDDVMDTELLSRLSKSPSPKELALHLNETNGGVFFEVRFGLSGSFFKEVASDNPEDTLPIFEESMKIAQEVGGRVSPGVVILAMIRQMPMKQTVLGHLQLSEDDLMAGIAWYHRLSELVADNKKVSKQPGGVGRDWSFGWIPTLSRFGVSLSHGATASRNKVRSPQVEQIMDSLSSGGGTIGLIGRDGSGKTEIVHELANRLMRPDKSVPKDLWYRQVFMLDASRILAFSSERGAVEQAVGAILGEAFAAKNIIVCFDNAELFFKDGVGSVDISALLLPIVEAGRLSMIMTIDEQNFLRISQQSPALANSMTRVMVQPTEEADTIRILEDHIPLMEYKKGVTFMYQALRESYKLSQRYVYDVSMPGQAIRLLQQASEHAEGGKLVTLRSVGAAIEATTGVKTGAASGEDEREVLLNLESRIHERMIGQERAVSVVADALRRARSGVRNQSRPVGTFLFLGPTGVGKTELAKSLAEVYFGGEQNIIRLDMNEFVSPDDVARLIADGADDAGSLAAQVMKQPFSVVLLDELEKAHSSVLTTLLQLLDEGVLRDVRGREVSFRDTVVIATSNAGAHRIQEYIERGYTLQQFEETFINELISSHIFHPEFLNRFDEMVVFSPLSKPELLKVVDLILMGVNKNLAEQQITVSVAADAKDYLVDKGYDPRLGARPMRRVVQRAVESTVAKLLLSGSVNPGGVIEITRDQVESILGPEVQAQAIVAGE